MKVFKGVNYKEKAVPSATKKRDRNNVDLPYVKPADAFALR